MPNEFRTSVGGQALMEGIMMRGPEKICCAVRKPDGTIDLTYDKVVTRWYNKVPLLRGVCNMAENLYKGYKYLMHAADVAMEGVEDAEPESKLDKWLDEYMAATLRPTTLNGYRRSLELHVKPYLGNKTLSKITAIDLRSLYRTLQETGRTSQRWTIPRPFRQNGPRHPHHPAPRPENGYGAEPDPQQSRRRS